MSDEANGRRPGFMRGQWPLLLSIGLALLGGGLVLAWGIAGVLIGDPPVGDGRNPETYGVDLSELQIDRDALAASGRPRDFLFPYEGPGTMPGSEVQAWNAAHARKWQKEVVSDDRVVGVEIAGQARAYPLFIVDAHEIVLDEVGDVPILVARSPLLDEVMVFERRSDDELVEPGVSGLLDDLAQVMHDGEEPASLISAHDGRTIAGPGVGARLRPVPGVSIVRWRDWLRAHPTTSVVRREPESMRRYRRISYDRYLDGTDWIIPPRREPPPTSSLASRDRVISLLDDTGRVAAVLPVSELRAAAVDDRVRIEVGGRDLTLELGTGDRDAMVVEHSGLVTRPGFWIGVWARDPEGAEGALRTGRSLLLEDAERPEDA